MNRAERDAEFAEFVRVRSPRLLLVARSICGNADLAEDLTQAALEKAYLKWARVRKADEPFSYVRRILVNLNTDRLRRKPWREQPTEFVDQPPAVGDRAGEISDRETVRRVLAQLTERERAVVTLRFLEDLSEAETARELGVRPGTVKSACARALGKLREQEELKTWEV